jgi:hypothetical protein
MAPRRCQEETVLPVRCLTVAAAMLLAACAQLPATAPSAAPAVQAVAPAPALAPLAQWVGGRWIGTFESGGRKFTLTRTYDWSFDGRTLVGRSYGERDGKLTQSRETVYFWNAETRRIEFLDFIDTGGYGLGWLERRDGEIYMDVKVVGNPSHPSWRAWIKDDKDTQVIRVEALRDGKWTPFGTYPYQRRP